MTQATSRPPDDSVLQGLPLLLAGFVLAMANFVAVLNMTVANVIVPNVSGALGASTSQGTWVITSYSVAEAFTVPLTGWLSARLGAVRVFAAAVTLFGVFSFFCGQSTTLPMLIGMRILQGLAGGPLMALSQTLLLRIFPKTKAMAAMGLWAMTTLLAPVVGPMLGGWLCDNYTWSWSFYIDVPLGLAFGPLAWMMLKNKEQPLRRDPIDFVGIVLLVIWVSALQIMLDEGKDLDWFNSFEIRALACVAVVGFLAFLIWELTDKHPIVDLKVFRHRGFASCMFMLALAYGAFFGSNVLTPLWLQTNMGYTATWAGMAVAWGGVLSVLFSPVAGMMSNRFDPRHVVVSGVVLMGAMALWRATATPDMSFEQVCIPLFIMGLGTPLFFVPLIGVAMASVDEHEMASGSGLQNFVRTLSGAIATSLVTNAWQNKATYAHAELANIVNPGNMPGSLGALGSSAETARSLLDGMVGSQSVLLSTNEIMAAIGIAFLIASTAAFFIPKSNRVVDPASVGH